ncbi:MAG: SAM-dependent methyltransferase [Bacteroidaceae bacterium]|nr:SAM-dependent methyltransferase [Bacteroidaceae bacterium]
MNPLTVETQQFIEQHADADIRQLALKASRYPTVDMPEAIRQIAGRKTARDKLPEWFEVKEIRYPSHLAMEQCSSEVTARYKARLMPTGSNKGNLIDMSGGLGVDFCYMAKRAKQATYIERQDELCELARHNFPLLGCPNAQIVSGDSIAFLRETERYDYLFIDPARRNKQGGKTIAICDCEPDVSLLEPLLLEKASWVMVKLSPMLDWKRALTKLAHVHEVHIVAVAGECKELLLIMTAEARSDEAEICPVNLPACFRGEEIEGCRFTQEEESNATCEYTNQPEVFLYEPHAAILKAGAFRTIAQRYGVKKLHPNSHLYTAETYIKEFPGRRFHIEAWGGFSKRETKELRERLPKANLTIRNFPSTVDELRKRLKINDGGDDYLFATTLGNGEKIWIHGKRVTNYE